MADLELNPNYLEMLIVKVRAVMAKELGDGDDASNAIDDPAHEGLADTPGDLTREEVLAEIRGLDEHEQAELVALMWLGRGDGEAEEWEQLVEQAAERAEGPAGRYLLSEPLLADYWADGLEKLGLGEGADSVDEL